jgi:hypothetical protein
MTQKGIARRLKVPISKVRKWTKISINKKAYSVIGKRRPPKFEKISPRVNALIREYL